MNKYLSLDMKKFLATAVIAVAGIILTAGIAAAGTGSIDTTGPDSENSVRFENESDIDVDNDTDVDANVNIDQDADSGDANVKYNTTGGDATSGDTENDSSLEAELSVDNSSSSGAALGGGQSGDDEGSINMTGPNSENHIVFNNRHEVRVNNNTNVDFDADVNQNANSGNANVWYNTTGGNATSGSASNTSSVVFSLSVTN